MSLTLAQLRAVDAVVREGQISRAAQSLGVSQPSISNQIHAFEAAWPIRFFERDGYSISVSAEAEPLLGRIRLAINLLDEIEAELAQRSAAEARGLSLGFSAHRLIMPALAKFVSTNPDIAVTTQGAPTMELLTALKRGEIHLASVSLPEPAPGFHAVEIARRRLVVYGRHDNPLLQQDHVSLTALNDRAMVLWNENSGSRRRFGALCEAAGIAPRIAMIVNSLDVAYAAAAAGLGLGVAVEQEIVPDDHIRVVPLRAEGAEIGQYLLCLKGSDRRPQVAAFIEIAKGLAESEIHSS